jgi:hypothetical protein
VGEGDGVAGVRAVEASEQSRAPEQHEPDPPRYWFPAERYGWGWGWGLPCAWQGWLVLAAYLGLMVGAARLCPPEKSVAGFVAAVLTLSAGLVAICWWRGEPVRWRWG